VSQNRNKSKVSQKAGNSVSQKPASQPEVLWRPQLGGPVASSKEVQVCRKPKQVESQPVVETVSQLETSQSAGCAMAVKIRWTRGVVEVSPISRKPKEVESQPEVETVSQPETSQSAGCVLSAIIVRASGVVEASPSQPKPKQVESESEVRLVSQPETSQSAGSVLASKVRWASGIVERIPSQAISETSRKSAKN